MQDNDMGPNSVIVVFHLLFFPSLLHVYIKNLSLFQVVKILLLTLNDESNPFDHSMSTIIM